MTVVQRGGLYGLFDMFFDSITAFLNESASVAGVAEDAPNVEAALSEGINPNILPGNQATLVQEGFNDATATIGAMAATAAVVAGVNAGGNRIIGILSKRLGHVVQRHTVIGTRTAGRSVFRAEENVVSLIKAAGAVKPVPQPHGNYAFIVNAGRAIGTDRRSGGPTAFYTVITDRRWNLVTAFPGLP
jgi:hypothetical protein